jgi:uncharacterized protein YndB with AHSA1/START domain
MSLTVSTTIRAPVDAVWRAYTTPADIEAWNAASADWHTPRARVDLRVGGTFCYRMEARDGSIGFDFEGTYTDVVAPQRLSYRFGDRDATVTFEPGADGVCVTVVFEPETTFSHEQQRSGWQSILDNFARHVHASVGA